MRQKRRFNLYKKKQSFIKKCPLGGMCANPLCMFGCIEKL